MISVSRKDLLIINAFKASLQYTLIFIMIAKCAVYGITVQEVPILIEVLVGIGELAIAVVALAETCETGGMTVQEVPILIEVLVGIGELAIAVVALAETSETGGMTV